MSENPTNVGFLGVDYLLRFEMLSIFKYNINIESSLAQQIRLFSV